VPSESSCGAQGGGTPTLSSTEWYARDVEEIDLVVVGAGSAASATAALPPADGLEPVVIEAGTGGPGPHGGRRYDSLRPNTPRLILRSPREAHPRRDGRLGPADVPPEYSAN